VWGFLGGFPIESATLARTNHSEDGKILIGNRFSPLSPRSCARREIPDRASFNLFSRGAKNVYSFARGGPRAKPVSFCALGACGISIRELAWHATCSLSERLLTGCFRAGKGPGSGVRAPSYRRHEKAGPRKGFGPFSVSRLDISSTKHSVISSAHFHARPTFEEEKRGLAPYASTSVPRGRVRWRGRAPIPHGVQRDCDR
jgi:hypothetical protein